MSIKTDLAKEIIAKKSPLYSKMKKFFRGRTRITEIRIETEEEAAFFEKPKGVYITVEVNSVCSSSGDFYEEAEAVAAEIKKIIPDKSRILAMGLGNFSLTAESLGPLAAEIMPCGSFFGKEICSFVPGVSGKTGVEPVLAVSALAEKLKPSAIIAIDALAAEDISHVGRSVQLTDSGIAPGSGIRREKNALSKETVGVPVIAIGMPAAIRYQRSDTVFVSPGDIDVVIKKAAKLVAFAVTLAVFPELGIETLKEMFI